MLLLNLTIAVVLISTIVSFWCMYIYVRKKSPYPDNEHALPVVMIVNAFQKLCPLGSHNHWHLLPVGVGSPRCWHRTFPIQILDQNIGVYGSSVIIKATTSHIMKIIGSTSHWADWIPFVAENLATEQFENPSRGNDFINAIKVINEFNENESYIFSHFSKNDVGWILVWDAKTVYMSFFIVQPLEKNGEGHCLLTYILGNYLTSYDKTAAENFIFKLNSIKEAAEIAAVSLVPFYLNSMENKDNSSIEDPSPHLVQRRRSKSEHLVQDKTKTLCLLPYMQRTITLIKRLKGFEVTTIPSENYADPTKGQLKVKRKKIKKKIIVKCQTEISGIQAKTTHNHENPFEIEDRGTSDVTLLSRKTPNTVSDEFEDQGLSVFDSKLHADDYEEDELSYYVKELDDTNLQRELDTAGEAATFEILLPERRISSQRRTDIRTNGNYCASVLQREVMEASTIGLIGCHATQSGGTWIIYAVINGITVRAKTCLTGSLKVFSYVCSIEVPAEPREVWNFIKNPSHRFICDESVKKVKILEELSSDQKIVHVYHEVGILRKECIDFCLLQTERQEQSKSYLAFYSIEFEACPLMDGVTRGTLFPSGFVIEAGSKGNKSTDVKFLFQFMSNIDSTFYQGLDVSVVNVLLNLKTYLKTKPI